MTKILVKKSAPKGILVKQVQPQLMQMPTGGKSLKDFVRVLRTPTRTQDTPGVSRGAKFAAGLGVLGKIGAGLSTVNQTVQSMQGGNLSAPLSAGYTFEAADPTGRMISEAADPSLSYAPAKQKLNRKPPAKFSVDAALDPQNSHTRGPRGPPLPADSPLARFGNPEAGLAPRIPGREQRQPSTYPQHTMSRRTAFNQLGAGQPTGVPFQAQRPSPVQVPPTHVPGAVASNVTIEPVGGVSHSQPPNYPGEEVNQVPLPGQEPQLPPLNEALTTLGPQPPAASFTVSPNQPVSYTGNLPQPTAITNPYANQNPQIASMVQNLTSGGMTGQGPVNPNNQQALIDAGKNMVRQSVQSNQPAPVAPQPAGPPPGYQYTVGQFAKNQENQTGVSPTFYQQQNKSFVTALTEKLGADIVYKMTPHQIGTFAAYTLLKLR